MTQIDEGSVDARVEAAVQRASDAAGMPPQEAADVFADVFGRLSTALDAVPEDER